MRNQVWQQNTAKLSDLTGAVQRAQQPSNGTDFFDALYSACTEPWLGTEPGVHRVVLVISDGEDTGSLHGLGDVVAAAQRNEIQIYTLNVHLKQRRYPGEAVLQRVADDTGGRFFVANNAPEAENIFRQLEQELRTAIRRIRLRPARQTPGFHALQVDVKAPQKLMVHARHGYYVAKSVKKLPAISCQLSASTRRLPASSHQPSAKKTLIKSCFEGAAFMPSLKYPEMTMRDSYYGTERKELDSGYADRDSLT